MKLEGSLRNGSRNSKKKKKHFSFQFFEPCDSLNFIVSYCEYVSTSAITNISPCYFYNDFGKTNRIANVLSGENGGKEFSLIRQYVRSVSSFPSKVWVEGRGVGGA
jgi:hypothetical protein